MAYKNLIDLRLPPKSRIAYCREGDGGYERHMSEAAVMLAFAIYLFDVGAWTIALHPDVERGKRFPIRDWLSAQGFAFERAIGKTNYGGKYVHGDGVAGDCVVNVAPKRGSAYLEANPHGPLLIAECRGGIVNSTHRTVAAHLKLGLGDAVGRLLTREAHSIHERHIAVVPDTEVTRDLAARMLKRIRQSNVEIAFVDSSGRVQFIQAER